MFTPALATALEGLLPAVLWTGLMSSDPLPVQDPLTVEVIGPVYARQRGMVFTSGVLSQNQNLNWYGLPVGTVIAGLGVFDAAVNGNLLFSLRTGPYVLRKGGRYSLSA